MNALEDKLNEKEPQELRLSGRFELEVWTPRDEGISKLGIWNPEDYELTHKEQTKNGIATVGIADMFEQYLRTGTGITPVIGLIDADGFTVVVSTDTMSSHTGWTEIHADYSEANRPAWGPDAAASAAITNSTKTIFTMTAAVNVKGLFITSNNTKNGTTGILWSTAIFGLTVALQNGQVARAGYSLSGLGA